MKLFEIAEVFSGLSFRSKVENEVGGRLSVIQLRDVDYELAQFSPNLVRITEQGVKEKYFLRDGDLLLIAKGANNRAFCFDETMAPAVASSSFFVVRCQVDKIYPPFLEWFLNHPQTQNTIASFLSGTYTPSLSKPVVEEIDVPSLPLKVQRNIGQLYALQLEEQHLMARIKEKRNMFMDHLLFNSIGQKE